MRIKSITSLKGKVGAGEDGVTIISTDTTSEYFNGYNKIEIGYGLDLDNNLIPVYKLFIQDRLALQILQSSIDKDKTEYYES